MNVRATEGRRWFRQAEADLAVVRTLRAAGHHGAACFYSQQAAEKALKAVLYSQGGRAVIGHSVLDLARQCEAHSPAFAGLAAQGALLDQFYVATRYPNGLPAPAIPSEAYSAQQAQTAQESAEQVLREVEDFLRSHTDALA
jgi:HEPN domain-containing protein